MGKWSSVPTFWTAIGLASLCFVGSRTGKCLKEHLRWGIIRTVEISDTSQKLVTCVDTAYVLQT